MENIQTPQGTSPLTSTSEVQPSIAATSTFPPASSAQMTARPNQDFEPGQVTIADPDHSEQLAPTTTSPSHANAPTSVAPIEENCRPFPSDILSLDSWDEEYEALCKGEVVTLPSPIIGASLLDYTPRTGRIVYTLPLEGEGAVWVYDYWTGQSQKWLDEDVEEAFWAPVKNIAGIQPLAVLCEDGQLVLVSGPGDVAPLTDDACCVSWSPLADRIAYSHDNDLYIMSVDGGQPRKLAENSNCEPPDEAGWTRNPRGCRNWRKPIWAIEHQAIILHNYPIRIAKLDGSGSFTPTTPAGIIPDGGPPGKMLWDPESRILLYSVAIESDQFPIWIYEFSDDLKTIVNIEYIPENVWGVGEWDVPGKSYRDYWGASIYVGPETSVTTFQAEIISISNCQMRVYIHRWMCAYEHCAYRMVTLTDQTQISDAAGNQLPLEALKKGMMIELMARPLHPNTFSLLVYKIQIQE